jgi:multidrug resistance efflux pump
MILNHPLRFFWILGVLVLMGSAAGTTWLINRPLAGDANAARDAAGNVAHEVVCFGHVDLEHGVVSLYSTQPGRVQSVPVEEARPVRKGQVLIQLDDRLARLLVEQAQADYDAAAAQEKEAQNLGKQKEYKLAEQRAAIDAVKHRLAAAEKVHERKKELHDAKQLGNAELEAAAQLVEELRSLRSAEETKLREVELLNPAAGLTRARADAAAKKARLEQAQLGLDECTVKAPADGTVLRVLIARGEILSGQPKQPAVLFCPNEDRIVRAEVEQEFAGRVARGMTATIQDDTTAAARDSSETWHGKVDRVSDWYTHRRSILQEPFQFNDVRTLECIIRLDQAQVNPQPLRIGQRVRVLISRAP